MQRMIPARDEHHEQIKSWDFLTAQASGHSIEQCFTHQDGMGKAFGASFLECAYWCVRPDQGGQNVAIPLT